MSDEVDTVDGIEFDEVLRLALAESATASSNASAPDLKRRLTQRVREATEPAGFAFALNKRRGYATLLASRRRAWHGVSSAPPWRHRSQRALDRGGLSGDPRRSAGRAPSAEHAASVEFPAPILSRRSAVGLL
jgi:hypothetical protein